MEISWFDSLTKEEQDAILIKESYPIECPYCSNEWVRLEDDGKDCFTVGRKFWVHYCEDDDNLHSGEIKFCPYCGNELIPTKIEIVEE